jgi:glycine C-acetyltransferase/8-amino-7-oxononanoate synthase
MVDEAHATGTVGPGGRGTVAAAGLGGEVDVLVGTLGKALGSYGAYVCASDETVEYLLNTARSFIFSTALPPAVVVAAQEALRLLESEPDMVQRLSVNSAVLREALVAEGLEVGDSRSQIVPVLVGDSDLAMTLSEALLEHGMFAQGIRPPTVPEGTSRLRLTAMSTHDPTALRRAARVLGAATRSLGLRAPGTVVPLAA